MRVIIQPDYEGISNWVADLIAHRINQAAPTAEKPFILGLPTGSTPLGTYRKLIELNKAGKLSFQNVITFNMDEYCGIPREHPYSYYYYMWENFFNHIDIKPENVNILDGNAPDLIAECDAYEQKIQKVGGINLFLGGVGENGHIAFNEPGSSMTSRTRVKILTEETIQINSRFFEGDKERVPKLVLTVGIGTIMDAQEVIIIMNGHNKARALSYAVEGSLSHLYSTSALQMHKRGIIVCDEEATSEIRVGTYKYFKDIEKKTSSMGWK